jgi:hypothetical protein
MIGHSSADRSIESGHVALLVGAAAAAGKGRPQHQNRTSPRVGTMNLKASRALIIRHTVSPWRAIILQALGLQGPNGLKTLEPRAR